MVGEWAAPTMASHVGEGVQGFLPCLEAPKPRCPELPPFLSYWLSAYCAPGRPWSAQGGAQKRSQTMRSSQPGAQQLRPLAAGKEERTTSTAFPHAPLFKGCPQNPLHAGSSCIITLAVRTTHTGSGSCSVATTHVPSLALLCPSPITILQ